MSIKVISLNKIGDDERIDEFVRAADIDYRTIMPYFLFFVLSMIGRLHDAGDIDAPAASAAMEIPREWEPDQRWNFGRFGLREITSTWAKEQFPDATRELVITLLDKQHDAVHVFLVFL